MSLERTLLSIAMESGAITEDAYVEIDDSEHLVDLLDSQHSELQNGLSVIESLEAIARRFESQPVTEESLENCRFTVEQIFKVSSTKAPVSVVVPSFEDASSDKGSMGSKIKSLTTKMIAWIREQIAKIGRTFVALKDRLVKLVKRRNDPHSGPAQLPEWMFVADKFDPEIITTFGGVFGYGRMPSVLKGDLSAVGDNEHAFNEMFGKYPLKPARTPKLEELSEAEIDKASKYLTGVAERVFADYETIDKRLKKHQAELEQTLSGNEVTAEQRQTISKKIANIKNSVEFLYKATYVLNSTANDLAAVSTELHKASKQNN